MKDIQLLNIKKLNNEEKGYIMKRKIPKITNSEKQILEVLWDEEKPLTSSEIVGVSDDRTWKASSVHLLLNSLLNKDLIEDALALRRQRRIMPELSSQQ